MSTTTVPVAPANKPGDTLPDMTGGTPHYIRDYFHTLKDLMDAVDEKRIAEIVDIIYDVYENDRRLVLCGNGGSGSTSSHLVCDFQKNILLDGGKPFEAIALTDSPALIMAWANDTDYSNIFAGQARTWLRSGDVLLAISGSGNSPNVLKAVEVANEVSATSIGFCGYNGGRLAEMAQIPVVIERRNMQQVEDMHMILGHIIFSALRDRITGRLEG
jgi:D-sedoheptulose 7-phosphate isomerase